MGSSYRNHGCRLHEYSTQGQRLLFLENELLRIGVLVDQGADIFEFLHKPTDTEFLLHTSRGIRPPTLQGPTPGWGAFLDYYEGGWQEILPNGGPACTYKGVTFGLHDEISLLPWRYRIIEDEPERVIVDLEVSAVRTPFRLQRRMSLSSGSAVLEIEETLTNEGREPLDYMWGHHPAFGAPFLDPACRVDLPGEALTLELFAGGAGSRITESGRHTWPEVPSGEGAVDFSRPDPQGTGHEDLGYVLDLPEGWYAITNQEQGVGFALSWSLETFPYLWVWRQFNLSAGYPWYGQVYTMALEPWSSYPSAGLVQAIENGSAALLQPGEQRHTTLRAVAYTGSGRVARVSPVGEITWK